MSDLLFRGRGADIGVRAPAWMVRALGAVLGLCLMQLLAELGVFSAAGVSVTLARVVCVATGVLLAPSAAGAWLWGVTAFTAGLLMLVSYTPLAAPLLDGYVRRDGNATPPPDAVVVFSGAVTAEGRVMGPALDRLLTGLAEAKRRGIPQVALSTVADEDDPTVATSERDQREVALTFAPELQLRFVHDVHSTRDEALAFAALARTHRWQRVLVVTSPSHSRRACNAVERAGLSVQCHPAISRSYALSRLNHPESRRLAFADVLYETAATLLYQLRGWM